MVYNMTIAGVNRDLPICKVSEDVYIGAFVIFGRRRAYCRRGQSIVGKSAGIRLYDHCRIQGNPADS